MSTITPQIVPNNAYPKTNQTSAYPVHATSISNLLTRVEALITPEELKDRFLKGILERLPRGVTYSSADLKNRINRAVNKIEADLGCLIFAEQITDRLAFDWNDYKAFIRLKVGQGPILSIFQLSITASDGTQVFLIPPDWVDTGLFFQGTIHVIPLLASYGASLIQGTQMGGLAFLTLMNSGISFVPTWWTVQYSTGIAQTPGQVPVSMNELIGIYAAQNILSEIASLNTNNSISLSSDGISQGSSSDGVRIYVQRNTDLETDRVRILRQWKRVLGKKAFLSAL